jgi:2-methylcitrate dehydratase PrpD
MGALVGLSAAVLAANGFAGAPAVTVEAPEVARYWDDLGSFWQVSHQYIKPYPVCRWAHAAIDGTRALCLKHRLAPEQIASVRVNSFHHAAALFAGMPDTTSKAQYSLRFAVATMIIYGRIGVEHISGSGLQDGAVAAMLKRIKVAESARHSARFPLGRWADVQIETVDGRLFDSGDVHARGGPEAPFAPDDIIAKYMEFAGPVLGEERAAMIRDRILGLMSPPSRFSDLAALLYDPPAGLRHDAA